VKRLTKSDEVLYIQGCDWDSSIPYYSQRKAIMDRSNYSITDGRFKQSISNLGGNKMGAMIYNGVKIEKNFMDKVKLFEMVEYNMNISEWKLFLAKKF
jgi:hypothetical protein